MVEGSLSEQFTFYLDKISPYAKQIVIFFIPIYIAIGTEFAKAGKWVVDLIPISDVTNFTFAYVIGVVFIIIGIIVGVLTDPERKEKEEKKS